MNVDNVKEIDMKEIWNYEPYSNSVPPYHDKPIITKNKDLADVYADKDANYLLRETVLRLGEIE